MARMWPRQMPDWVANDPRRSAEIKTYRRLEDQLDDSWVVYYSRPWRGLNSRGGEVDGEADFIIGHAQHGLLFVEVKGGLIAVDPELGTWTSRDRHGIRRTIKNPVDQAKSCKHQFLRRLRGVQGWPHGRVRVRHAVVLPDTNPPAECTVSIAGEDKDLFCHADRFDDALGVWVESRLSDHGVAGGERGPGPGGLAALHSLVADPAEMRVPIRRQLEGDIEHMETLLTGTQLLALGILSESPRVVVEGGAGTGKTLLATEFAARSAESGSHVLLLCVSRPLAEHLTHRLSGCGVEVLTLGPFLAARRGPQALLKAAGMWDTVIVDEAQDVDAQWWRTIESAVKTPGRGGLYVFMDSNQAIYRLASDLATTLQAASIPLRNNLRNTRRIATVSDGLYEGPLIQAPGPAGSDPVVVNCDAASSLVRAAEALSQLVRDESVPHHMITVLTPDTSSAREFRARATARGVACSAPEVAHVLSVTVTSIAEYKGLESPLVILVTDDRTARDTELSYVGVTRARTRLLVFGPVSGTRLGRALEAT